MKQAAARNFAAAVFIRKTPPLIKNAANCYSDIWQLPIDGRFAGAL